VIFFFAFSCLLTWASIPFARKVGIVSDSAEHRVHKSPLPQFGGIGIVVPFITFLILNNTLFSLSTSSLIRHDSVPFLLCSFFILILLGIIDDKFGLSAAVKIPFQVIVGILLIAGKFVTGLPLVSNQGLNICINWGITLVWFMVMINSFNIIDGLDGLAGGISISVLFFLIIFDVFILKTGLSFEIIILIACIFGFLLHNRYPAKTFMGDTGSTFLGAVIAVYTLRMGIAGRVSVMVLIPIILLLYPFFDVVLAVIRRSHTFFSREVRRKKLRHYLKFIFSGDKEHIHHKLLGRNEDHKKTVFLLLVINVLLGVLSIVFFFSHIVVKFSVLIFLAGGMFFVLKKLEYLPRSDKFFPRVGRSFIKKRKTVDKDNETD
jgi:UDP-GlcNAc:undecaprenyl-phosphate GlcNAc-1-phosphate transferase